MGHLDKEGVLIFYKKIIPKSYIIVLDKTRVFINKDTEKVIIGSMISYYGRYLESGEGPLKPSFDYYYPNTSKNSLWKFLFAVFDQDLLKKEKVDKFEKEKFLIKNKIGITNLIAEAFCEPGNSNDSAISVVKLKEGIVEAMKKSQVKDIYFTSKNVKVLFERYLVEKKYEHSWRDTSETDSFLLEIEGRKLRAHTLPSPTNRGGKGQTLEWKLRKYWEKLGGATRL